MKKMIGFLLFFSFVFPIHAQEEIVIFKADQNTPRPIIDGILSENEYLFSHQLKGKITVYTSLFDDDTIYFAIQSTAKGWVAIGFGEFKMHKSNMIIGYKDDTTEVVSEHIGKNRLHTEKTNKILEDNSKTATYKISENEKGTLLEFQTKLQNITDSDTIKVVVGQSKKDNLTSFRSGSRYPFAIKIKDQ